MTAEQEVRAIVEAWRAKRKVECPDGSRHFKNARFTDECIDDLITRLVPLAERAHEERRCTCASCVAATPTDFVPRERAERAEAKVLLYESDANAAYMMGKSFMRGQLEPQLLTAQAQLAERDAQVGALRAEKDALHESLHDALAYLPDTAPGYMHAAARARDEAIAQRAAEAMRGRCEKVLTNYEARSEELSREARHDHDADAAHEYHVRAAYCRDIAATIHTLPWRE